MTKTICLFVSLLIISNSAWSAQRFLRTSSEGLLHDSLHCASRYLPTVRFFSSTHHCLAKATLPSDGTIQPQAQTFSYPTFDAAFKYVMKDPVIRLSFLQTFAPDEKITKSVELSEYLNPLQAHHDARAILDHREVKKLMAGISRKKPAHVSLSLSGKPYADGGKILHALAKGYGKILGAFPRAERNSQVDLLCKTQTGNYTLVELQVIPQNYWDKRALAYAAKVYGDQLKQGDKWGDLKRVIAINILGSGPKAYEHWSTEEIGKGMRHYKFRDEKGRILEDGIELIQYSIMHINKSSKDVEFREWVDYFDSAHTRTMDYLKVIKTEAVKQAYRKLLRSNWPKEVNDLYDQQEKDFSRYSDNTKKEIEKGKVEGKIEALKEVTKMIKDGKTVQEIELAIKKEKK